MVITGIKATELVNSGSEAFAVCIPGRHAVLFDDYDMAVEFADKNGVAHVLDWETGEYV